MGEDASDRIKRIVLERDKLRAENKRLTAEVWAAAETTVKLRASVKKVLDQANADGGHGQTLAFEDALRELESAYYRPAQSEGDPT